MRNNRQNQEVVSGSTRFHPALLNSLNSYKPESSYCHKHSKNTNDFFSCENVSSQCNSNANLSRPAHPNSVFPRHSGYSAAQSSNNARLLRFIKSFQTSNYAKLLRVKGTVAHVPNLLCTLDTASTVSMMTALTAHQHGFKILPSNILIKSANNAVSSVLVITDSLSIDIQGHNCQFSFIVLEHDDHELLLGINWFKLTGASIHPNNLVLNIGTSDPLFQNPAVLHDDNDIHTAPILSSIIVYSHKIDLDEDCFPNDDVSMKPVAKLYQEQTFVVEKLS